MSGVFGVTYSCSVGCGIITSCNVMEILGGRLPITGMKVLPLAPALRVGGAVKIVSVLRLVESVALALFLTCVATQQAASRQNF